MSRPDDPSHTDEAWREIVANFGERASIDEPTPTPSPDPVPVAETEEAVLPAWLEDEGTFVPPEPPKVPRPRTWQRGAAWSGVLVAPVLALVLALTTIYVPPLFGVVLMLWFLGGFAYLVATMPKGPTNDPWDDGSRV